MKVLSYLHEVNLTICYNGVACIATIIPTSYMNSKAYLRLLSTMSSFDRAISKPRKCCNSLKSFILKYCLSIPLIRLSI